MSEEQNENIIEKKRNIEKIKQKKNIKKIIIAVVSIVVLIFLWSSCSRMGATVKKSFNYEEVTADVGDINIIVDGKGTVTQNSIYAITPNVTGEILEDYTEVGKSVEKGDLLYVIDSDDISSTVSSAKLAVDQASLSYNNVRKQISDLDIVATASGYVSGLTIEKGTYVSNLTQICNIVEANSYEVVMQFANTDINRIKVGDRASLFLLDYVTDVDAVVTNVGQKSSLLDGGAQVVDVTLKAETAGYSLSGAKAWGNIYTSTGSKITSSSTAIISDSKFDAVRSKSSGTVKEIYAKEGSYVSKGDIIATLSNDDLQTSLQNASIALSNAKNSYSNVDKQLENYYISSPITGKIVYKNSSVGDVISNYQLTADNTLAIVADTSTLKFNMDVDELDISKIKLGQKVIVTIDALDSREFEGTVANINTIGKTISGITSYAVTIELPENDEIYSGMNVTADIEIASLSNVIRIPLSAVRKGNVVYMKTNNAEYQDADKNVPMGYKKVDVEIGQNNSDYIEVLSGVNEGDVVLVDKLTQSGAINMRNLMRGEQE